jgi:hypothetical protein
VACVLAFPQGLWGVVTVTLPGLARKLVRSR